MKYILAIFVCIFSFSSQEKQVLKGNFKIVYIRGCGALRTKITFQDSIYFMTDSPMLRGKINYGKTLTYLDEKNLVIDFKTKHIKKDTIDFEVHSKNGGAINYLDVSIASGKFIRLK